MSSARMVVSLVSVLIVTAFVLLWQLGAIAPTVSADPADLFITALSCDTSPEYVRIHNFGAASQSLSGFRLQSDPLSPQDYDLYAIVAAISPAQTIELQSGPGAADDPTNDIYKLIGSRIYRNSDPADYARLVRSDSSSQQVNCGSAPVTPSPTPNPTPTPSPAPTPSPSPGPRPGDSLFGDANCDHSADSVDALSDLLFVAKLPPTAPCINAGDVTCDGAKDSLDALGILRNTARLPRSPVPSGCPEIGSIFGAQCGAERWRVKTLSDAAAIAVDFSPQSTTVNALRNLAAPDTLPDEDRGAPTELTVFTMQVSVQEMKLEEDHDFHVVVADPSTPGDTMIVEFADTACSGAIASAQTEQIAKARQDFIALFGEPTTAFTPISGTVQITGVGFFDFLHGQTGVAPNGIELHPVLAISHVP